MSHKPQKHRPISRPISTEHCLFYEIKGVDHSMTGEEKNLPLTRL